MITKNPYYIIVVFFLFSALGLKAQKTVVSQELYWLRYYNLLKIDERFTWHNEVEMRRFWEGNVQHHFIAHTRMHYKTGQNTNAAFGLTYSRQSPQDPYSLSTLAVPEFRLVQEFNYNIPMSSRLALQQRLRIDERFIRRNDGLELLEGFTFNFRFRIRLQANYRLNRVEAERKTILKLSNEVMFNAGSNILYNQFDQNRIYLGIERELNDVFSAEVGYLNWYQQTAAGDLFYSRDILRITIYHKLKI